MSIVGRLIVVYVCTMAVIETVSSYPTRLTFELPDNDAICFYDFLVGPTTYNFFYDVIHGGDADIDIQIKDENDKLVMSIERSTYDDIVLNITQNGTYSFCFNNEFSSISHKIVYFELHPGNYETLGEESGIQPYPTAMTLIESVLEVLHHFLSRIESLDIDIKNRRFGDSLVAEDLNSAVLIWSIIVSFVVILTTFGQLKILKSFFSDKKMAYTSYHQSSVRT